MNVRLLDWRDLPSIHRYHRDCVYLDSALVLTRGPLLIEGALFSSFLSPSMVGVFTCVLDGEGTNGDPVIGQFTHFSDSPISHLTFLTPESALSSPRISALLEYMIVLSGERGALRLLADVNESSQAFDSLRRCGFTTYTRQRVWQITENPGGRQPNSAWRAATSRDIISIRSLYNNLVPPLVQQTEPFSTQIPKGWVYYQEDDLLAYVEMQIGRRGIWAHPFVHPDTESMSVRFHELVNKISGRRSRPLYMCIRSYQAWLEPFIEELGAEAATRQAVMMRQLAIHQKAARPFALPALETGQSEIPAPVARYLSSSSIVKRKKSTQLEEE